MKRVTRFAFLLLSPLLCCFQCEKEEVYTICAPEDIQEVATQEIGPVHLSSSLDGQPETKAFQANSQAELAAAVPSDQLQALNIDFARYTLVGGISRRAGGISVSSQKVTLDCRNMYTYSVRLADSPTLSPTNLFFGLLVPKLPKGTTFSYEIHAYQ